ncbi:hypothetical protein CBS101457_001833 [Exobasidium rhododendri]|nr:hypothetical protein CBS101457_001833 [Exobasidium rhododendri]
MVLSSFLSWFRPWWKSSETDYDTVLSRLTKEIDSVQGRLVHVNRRERRASITLTLYAILVWLVYAVFLWYWTAERRLAMSKKERFQLWSSVLLGLLFIISTRSLVRWWYRKIATGEEKHLRSLQGTRRKKIDEIKLATRYDHLRNLLEKYDDTAVKPTGGPEGTSKNKSDKAANLSKANQTPQKRSVQGPVMPTTAASLNNDLRAVPGNNPTVPNPALQRPERFQKTWMDKVADKILGAENGGQPVAAEQKYALICRICFTHNGLCPKEDWQEVQYICPRCGTFNSRRPSSAPVSSPWTKSSRKGQQSPDSLTRSPPASPSPSGLHASFNSDLPEGRGDELDVEEEDENSDDAELMREKKKEKESQLRNRKSAGKAGLDKMDVD